MIKFRPMQYDPEVAHRYVWAKKEALRLIDSGLQYFTKDFVFDDAQVKIKADKFSSDWEIKIWAVASKLVDYVGVAMLNPVAYRGVSVGVVAGIAPSPVAYVIVQNTVTYTNQARGWGVWTLSITWNNGGGTTTGTYTVTQSPSNSNYGLETYNNYSAFAYNPPGGYSPPYGTIRNGSYDTGAGSGSLIDTIDPNYTTAVNNYNASLAANPTKTYIMASDGTVLASEVQNTAGGHTYYVPNTAWNGDAYVNMYVDSTGNSVDHQLTFTVPEDCIYPVPTTPNTAFNSRRKAWLKKNSDEFIAAIGGGFKAGVAGVTHAQLQTGALPASWDYAIKTKVYKSAHTYQPILLNATYQDVIVSDTSANLTQAGTKATKRSVTFQYVDATGANQTITIDGTLTQVVTQHTLNGSNIATSRQDSYANWYSAITPGTYQSKAMQIVLNNDATHSELLWSGIEQLGELADSTWSAPGNPLTYAGYSPAYPAYSNTLAGTAPPFVLNYHNTVLPKYDATKTNQTAWNNSALYNVRTIELSIFGPVQADGTQLGIFADPSDADGCTQIAHYGKAQFSFDWTTGSLTWKNWHPKQDANGAPKIVSLPTGYSYKNVNGTLYLNNGTTNYAQAYNCAIGYGWNSPKDLWPDVLQYHNTTVKTMKSGGGDQVLYTVTKQ